MPRQSTPGPTHLSLSTSPPVGVHPRRFVILWCPRNSYDDCGASSFSVVLSDTTTCGERQDTSLERKTLEVIPAEKQLPDRHEKTGTSNTVLARWIVPTSKAPNWSRRASLGTVLRTSLFEGWGLGGWGAALPEQPDRNCSMDCTST